MTKKKKKPAAKKKSKFKLEQWHKTMIIILTTAAVFGLGGRVINGIVGACASIDNRWTHTEKFEVKTAELADEIQLVGQRLQQKITQDQVDWRQKRMAELLSKYGSFQSMPEDARSEYLRLQKEIEDLRAGKQLAF